MASEEREMTLAEWIKSLFKGKTREIERLSTSNAKLRTANDKLKKEVAEAKTALSELSDPKADNG